MLLSNKSNKRFVVFLDIKTIKSAFKNEANEIKYHGIILKKIIDLLLFRKRKIIKKLIVCLRY